MKLQIVEKINVVLFQGCKTPIIGFEIVSLCLLVGSCSGECCSHDCVGNAPIIMTVGIRPFLPEALLSSGALLLAHGALRILISLAPSWAGLSISWRTNLCTKK